MAMEKIITANIFQYVRFQCGVAINSYITFNPSAFFKAQLCFLDCSISCRSCCSLITVETVIVGGSELFHVLPRATTLEFS